MISNQKGKSLHDKATTGLPLTKEEQSLLAVWYEEQDAQEQSVLKIDKVKQEPEKLYQQIEKALEQLTLVINRLQEMTADNQTLRKDNESLRLKVAHLFRSKSA